MKLRISLGPIAGLFSVLMMIFDFIMLLFWQWMDPDDTIELAKDFDYKAYSKNKEAFGDHTFGVDCGKNNKYNLNNLQNK